MRYPVFKNEFERLLFRRVPRKDPRESFAPFSFCINELRPGYIAAVLVELKPLQLKPNDMTWGDEHNRICR